MNEMGISKGLFGLDKNQVNQYIADLKADYDVIISQKNDEIEKLKKENERLNELLKEFEENKEKIKQDKEAIACVLLKAQEQANQIIDQTRVEFEKEKNDLEVIVEKEREKLLDVKKDLGTLKLAVVTTLEKYAKELEKLENGTVTKSKRVTKTKVKE
ncbi:MAG: hypothetical protein E7311_02235 [Clostridiales bacterium]|nr:hypothetical protein [Clostridiales bacterium]